MVLIEFGHDACLGIGMKKLFTLAAFVGFSGLLHATTINAPSSLIGANALDGNNAYSWGISISVPTGQEVTSAQIDFSSIKLSVANSSGSGYLYTDLLNSKSTGVTSVSDGDAPGDYWASHTSAGNIATLGTQFFASTTSPALTWSYVLTASQISTLNSFLSANGGIFNIGIDPDCHYNVGNISFTYNTGGTSHNTVPDVATTALLLFLGLAGLEVCRRQFTPAKAKA